LSNHRRASGPEATILCDGRVLGPYYGRSIRAALTGTESRFGRVVVYPPDIHPRSLTLAGDVVAMGSRANEVVALATGARVILVLPAVAAPAVDLPSVRRVALPEFDQLGFARGWLQWCDTYGHAATVLPDLGQDGRSAFAALVAELGPDPKR
jgi:hypothetical protein